MDVNICLVYTKLRNNTSSIVCSQTSRGLVEPPSLRMIPPMIVGKRTFFSTTGEWLSGMNGCLRNMLWDTEITGLTSSEEL